MNSLNYARAFAGIDHQFIVVTLVPKLKKKHYEKLFAQFDEIDWRNVAFSPIFLESANESFRSFSNSRDLFRDFAAIVRTVTEHRPDAVIAMYAIHAYPLILLKKLLGFGLFAIVSGGDLELHKGVIWTIIRKAVYSNSRIVFTVGHRLKAQIEKESGCRAFVIPTGTDPDYYRPTNDSDARLRKEYRFSADDFVVLSLSFLIERKCVDDVIRAIAQLKNKYANVKMIVAGDGPDRCKLMHMCNELRLSESILFTGSVTNATKRDLMNMADVYVIASYQEGMPFSLMEAMSCGCICLSSNVGDIPHLIKDAVNGFLIAPRDPQLLASKIEDIMNRSELELSMIRNRARQTILHRYDFRKLAREMVEIIRSNMYSERIAR